MSELPQLLLKMFQNGAADFAESTQDWVNILNE